MAASDFQRDLLEEAAELRPDGQVFVSVLNVAYELGTVVSLRLCTTSVPSSAQIDLGTRPPRIVLYRRAKVVGEREVGPWEDNLLTPRERFSVAHELGHWIAHSRMKTAPQSERKAYWEQERAINAFAGSLLVPKWLVARWLEEIPEGMPVSPFALRYWANSQCRCSQEVVAKVLVRSRDSIGFLKLLPTKRRKDGGRVLQVLCSAAGAGFRLPSAKSHIDSKDLRELLEANLVGEAQVQSLRLGRCEPLDLRMAWRRGKRLGSEETIWLSMTMATGNADLTKAATAQLSLALAE